MLAGLLMTRILKPLKLPAVTAYLIAGVLIGPYCLGAGHIPGLGFTSAEAVSSLSLVSEVALGFIALSIGNEFRLKDLKETGHQAAVIGVVQALVATLSVDLALLAGVNPVAAAVLVSFWSAVTFVLPTDAVPMFTYKFRYYNFPDMMKAGIPVSIVVAVLVALLIPFGCNLLGC